MISIKKEYENEVIGFNNNCLPLKDRDDLYLLAISAIESNDTTLLKLFNTLPALETLKTYKIMKQLRTNG